MWFYFNVFKRNRRLGEVTFNEGEIEEILNYSYKKMVKGSILEGSKFFKNIIRNFLKWKVNLLIRYLSYYYDKNKVDMIIAWNGLQYHASAAVKTADKMEIKTVYMENGYLPGTLVVDPAGVNYYNSLAGKDIGFYKKVEIDEEKLYRIKQAGIKKVELRKNIKSEQENFVLPDKYIFLPFQVRSDTQIMIHSPLVDNMEEFVEAVWPVIKRLNSNYWLIAKEHPRDIGRIDYDFLRDKYKNEKVKILKKGNTGILIQNSEAVITVNSTVGIEALLYYKPVVTFGNAFYNLNGLVYHVDRIDELYLKIKEALAKGVDRKLINKFLYFLRYHYLVEADKNNKTVKGNKQVIDRLKNLAGGECHIFSL